MVSSDNHLIARMSRPSRVRLLELAKMVPLTIGEVLCPGGDSLEHAYFPVQGFISLVTLIAGVPVLEVVRRGGFPEPRSCVS